MNNTCGELKCHSLGRGTHQEQHEKLLRVDAHARAVGIVGRAVGRQAAAAVGRHHRGLGTAADSSVPRRLQRRHVLNVVALPLLLTD